MSKKEYIKEDILKFLGGTSSIINTLIAEMEERIKIRVIDFLYYSLFN